MVKHVNGLQDPLLGQKLNFREYSKEFIQLLLDGKHHWVRIITLDCQPGEVNYYNSKFKGKLTKSVKNEICCITRFKGENIKIDIVPVQQQQNGFQCGAYAIEFTVFLIKKEDLTSISFYEKSCDFIYMIATISKWKKNVESNTEKSISFDLFCSCSLNY